jgi:hypothetical protein
VASTLAFAQQPPETPQPPTQEPSRPAEQAPPPEAASEPETTSTREVPADVVSSDTSAKNIKVKVMVKKDASSEPEAKELTIRVDDEAVSALDAVSSGDKVKMLCRMNGNNVIAVKDIKKTEARTEKTEKTAEP